MIDTRLPAEPSTKELEPVGPGAQGHSVGHRFWFMLFVAACIVFILALLSL